MTIRITITYLLLFIAEVTMAQDKVQIEGKIREESGQPIENVVISALPSTQIAISDSAGRFTFTLNKNTNYTLSFQSVNIEPFNQRVFLASDTLMEFTSKLKTIAILEVEINADQDAFGIRKLRAIENGGLYEGKKSEVINVRNLLSNKANNNARQAFSKIPSLNIWESDNAGLQLDIGGRGLSPKRTSNFNTRQNSYDISADALGYPESYYTPPLQAVEQIEMVRGAAALQYGTQFGGLLNFKMRKGNPEKRVNVESENTYGSFSFFNSFTSVHGQVKKLNYYSYIQYKQGDGWRPNANFEQLGAFVSLNYELTKKLNLSFDYTHMNYLSQQAGGLTDNRFELDPNFSNRSRNWFRVQWNLAALSLEYKASNAIKIYSRTFGLNARRTSLGLRETPDLEDPMGNRDLIDGKFRNLGNETRFVYTYTTPKGLINSLLVGSRLYLGNTDFTQGFGTAGSEANFTEVDTAFLNRRKSDFSFPNFNAAFFMEKILRLSPEFSLIPGIRYEHIQTSAEGSYTNNVRTNSFGDFIERRVFESNQAIRNVILYGLGTAYKWKQRYEFYANATANYRAINFTDIQIQTNTQIVDPNIEDESGYSFDLGLRKLDFKPIYFETGLFYILYDNRIGELIDDGLRLRTNIGAAQIFGAELFIEADLLQCLKLESEQKLSAFFNGSVNYGVYTSVNERALVGVRSGNKVEDLPDYNLKTGLNYGYKNFKASIQASFLGFQYSDAANTEEPYLGVFGPIPAYRIFDFSGEYKWTENLSLGCSINNFLDADYFTRRATAYPGPGIIPAEPRSFYFTLTLAL
ncbi:MAG: TonB-dependent receptor [Vicingaceae bacterium]